MEPSSSRLFINADVFSEHHVARVVRSRDGHLRQLRACVAPAFRNSKPLHTLLLGPPGTGKTLVALYVLQELAAKGLLTAYVNCMEHGTLHSVLEKIISEHKILRSERIGTTYKREQVERFLKGRPFVVVLDEVDKVPPKDRAHLLYNLASLGNVGLICIGSNPQFLQALEENVRSRFMPTVIEFAPYSVDELMAIISGRADGGLVSTACPEQVALALARFAGGDARTAIQALRRAAVNAGQRAGDAIETRDVKNGWKDGAELKRNFVLSLLNDHQRALFRLVGEFGELSSTRLRQEYEAECVRLKLNPISQRTFTNYMAKLLTLGLVEARESHNRRLFRTIPLPASNGTPNDEAA